MAKDLGDFLIERRIIGKEQLAEARALAKSNGGKVHEVLIKQGYATSEQVMQAMADLHGYEFVDLRDVPIPPAVVELVPESVARENAVIPLSEEDGALKVLVSDPFDYETFEKLQFILNRKVDIALATRESILEAINRNYGQMGDESADSMLQEFTDTAIDFTETEEGQDETSGEDVDETKRRMIGQEMPAALCAVASLAELGLLERGHVLGSGRDRDRLRAPQRERIHWTARPRPAGRTVAVAHGLRLAGDLHFHSSAETASDVDHRYPPSCLIEILNKGRDRNGRDLYQPQPIGGRSTALMINSV